jgi:hypothetical protein
VRLGIMQPYVFPYIGYFQLVNTVDKFVIYDDVNFINKGWINRNKILINKNAYLFSIPLKNASQNRLINEVEVAIGENWQRKFLRTIEQAYKRATNFEKAYSILESVLNTEVSNIAELALNSIRSVVDYLELSTEFVPTSALYGNANLKSQQRILDICKIERTNEYINPIGGKEIYSKELFEREGIKLNFLKTKEICYKQFGEEFVPNLSMIDVLMFNSKTEIREMLNLFELM